VRDDWLARLDEAAARRLNGLQEVSAQTRGEQVLVVSMATIRNGTRAFLPGAVLRDRLPRQGDGEADDRILHRAECRAEHGQHVTW